jgi:predicted nucleotidyltransferase
MQSSIERVIDHLNRAEVRYIVVGGVAVVLHGHLRVTADLDLVVELEQKNAEKAVRVLEDLGWRPRAPVSAQSFTDAEKRRLWAEEKGMTVFSFWHPEVATLEVDVFVQEPFDFGAVYARAVMVELDDTQVKVIGLDDLIALKKQAGRHQDLADVEALQILVEDENP